MTTPLRVRDSPSPGMALKIAGRDEGKVFSNVRRIGVKPDERLRVGWLALDLLEHALAADGLPQRVVTHTSVLARRPLEPCC